LESSFFNSDGFLLQGSEVEIAIPYNLQYLNVLIAAARHAREGGAFGRQKGREAHSLAGDVRVRLRRSFFCTPGSF
jgi:hypothetical protein